MFVALLTLAAGCQLDPWTTADPPRALPAQLEALAQRMHTRYDGARLVHAALAHSNLGDARRAVHALTLLDEPDVLPAWKPYFAAVAEAARQVEGAADVGAAARKFGLLASRCAECHDASHGKVVLAVPSTLPGRSKMVDHERASFQMWQGLATSSDAAWLDGANALTTVPLTMVAQAATPSSGSDVDDVARIRLYARRALDVQDRGARAEVFGTLLAKCAHCHAVLRDR